MTCAYPRARELAATATDLLLVLVVVAVLVLRLRGPLGVALATGIPCVLAWGALTLHFPRRVELDEEGISFSGYGHTHRYSWREVTVVTVRRFLVGDRVLVRLAPAPAWRGRYWLLDVMEGYPELLAALDARARRTQR